MKDNINYGKYMYKTYLHPLVNDPNTIAWILINGNYENSYEKSEHGS